MTRREFGLLMASAPAANLLSQGWSVDRLQTVLLSRGQWRYFPAASDRASWEALPADARAKAVASGARWLRQDWPSLPATVFLDYKRDGNRSRFEALQFARRNRLRSLVVAECVEGQGRFLDEILNGLWLTCEESFWGVPAHLNAQKAGSGLPDVSEPIVDLFAAETASLVAWSDYLLAPQFEKLSPLLRPRLQAEVMRRILEPCSQRDDFGWMGFTPPGRSVNNWNPWINSNWLACALLMEPDARRRAATVHKILRSLGNFLAGYAPDGGCDEGPSYWGRAGASLFDCLELLRSASAEAVDFYGDPLIRNIGLFPVRVHIAGEWYVNFADASAKPPINGDLLFRYGVRVRDGAMQRLGAWTASAQGVEPDSIAREIAALFNLETIRRAPHDAPPLLEGAWMAGIQVMTSRRQAGASSGFYVAAQGGHNAESHNHNDVGNFVVFKDGLPVLIDVGVETYTAKTFSAKRYEIWTMQSAYHNVPTINGVMQGAGRQFEARDVTCSEQGEAAEFRLEMAGAYPAEAGVDSWRRAIRLDRKTGRVTVVDSYRLRSPGGRIELNFITSQRPVAAETLTLAGARMSFDPALKPAVDEIDITDPRLQAVWGRKLYRLRLVLERAEQAGTLRTELI